MEARMDQAPQQKQRPRAAVAALGVGLLVVLLLVLAEGLSYVVGKILAQRRFIYDPPSMEGYPEYLRDRDPVLGWPAPKWIGVGRFDASGSRVVPRFPDSATPNCGVAYGDSFTWGGDVESEHAYGNVLSGLLGCRVGNFGVEGYGTDQAYLRYQNSRPDGSRFAILGHYVDDVVRNINQERGYLTNQLFGLKPRFILDAQGKLELVPLPELSIEEYQRLPTDGARLLPHEYFVPGGPSGVQVLRFPYSISLLRLSTHFRLRAKLAGRISYSEFYEPGHPSRALDVTAKIILAFVAEARARGQIPLVLLIPDHKAMLWLREHGQTPYVELERRLQAAGLVLPDVAAQLQAGLAGADPCSIYAPCGGHFNPEGYARLAGIAHEGLLAAGWTGQMGGAAPPPAAVP